MRNRRAFLAGGVAILVTPLVAHAQQAGQNPRPAVLSAAAPPAAFLEAFGAGLRDRGWVPGTSLTIDYHFAGGRDEKLADLAAGIVALEPAVIAGLSAPAVIAASRATRRIPIVMVAASDPVGLGLVASLARPGGNITGNTFHTPETSGKIVELIAAAVPQLRRLAVLGDSSSPAWSAYWREAEAAARAKGISLTLLEARRPEDLRMVFAVLETERPDAMYVVGTSVIRARREEIVAFAQRRKLPAIYTDRLWLGLGGLMAYFRRRRRAVSTSRVLHRPDLKGRSTGRSSHRAARQVRAGRESQDGEDAWSHDPAVDTDASGPCDRVMNRSTLSRKRARASRTMSSFTRWWPWRRRAQPDSQAVPSFSVERTRRARRSPRCSAHGRGSPPVGTRRWTMRVGLLVVALLVFAVPPAGEAQDGRQARHLAILAIGPSPSPEAIAKGSFTQALRRLGWHEGRNLLVNRRYTTSPAKLSTLAAELIQLRPDVIAVANAEVATIVRRQTTTIPIVALAAGDLVAAGLAVSLGRPGGNVTGIQIVQTDLIGKRLELLREAVGNLQHVAALTARGVPALEARFRHEFEATTKLQDIRGAWVTVDASADIEDAFKEIARQHVQAVLVFGSPFLLTHRRRVVDLAAKYRLPAMYELRDFVTAGGLMSYGVDLAEMFAQAATHVDKILRGANPGEIPIQQPTKFELVINLKTGEALGLTVPSPLLLRADRVIK